MDQNAFARCQRFLNYHLLGKWLSIISSVGTAILYVCLLGVLGLFIDLMVSKGEIPSYYDLPANEQRRFLNDVMLPDDKEGREARIQQVQEELQKLGLDSAPLKSWAKGEPIEKWSAREPALLWWAELPPWLDAKVGSAAGEMIREQLRTAVQNRGTEVALYQTLGESGILSLVVRNRQSFAGGFFEHLAYWNEWMWAHGNTGCLFGLFLLAFILAGLRLLLRFLSSYMAALAVLEAVTRLRRSIYHHTNRLGMLAFRALGPSEAVSVSTRHLEGVHDGLFQWLTVYLREPIKFGLIVAFTLLVNFWLAVAFLLFALLVWLIGGQIAASFRKQGRRAEMHSANQLALIQESLMMMRLVKGYLMEAFNQTRVERQLNDYARAQLLRYRAEATYRSLFIFLGLAAALILFLVAGYVVLLGRLGVTSTLVLAAAIISLSLPTLAFLEARRSIRRSRESAKVLFRFLDQQGGVGQSVEAAFLAPMTKLIQFDKVVLQEPGTERKLLDNVSFNIRAGQRIAIVGPDETEKHALVYLLPRFLDPTSGEIRIDGKNLRWVTLESLRAQIAMVLQFNLVFNDTVANNIGCGDLTYNLQRITEAAKLAHAHHFIQKLPLGYETVIGDMGHALKPGEKFRIALARAVLRDPAILIIEESHIPLDEDTKAMIDDTFQRVLTGRTVIFLPHRLSTIRGCDQVFLLHQGQIEASGEHRDLLASSDLYRHLQYLEFNEFASLYNSTGVGEPPA